MLSERKKSRWTGNARRKAVRASKKNDAGDWEDKGAVV